MRTVAQRVPNIIWAVGKSESASLDSMTGEKMNAHKIAAAPPYDVHGDHMTDTSQLRSCFEMTVNIRIRGGFLLLVAFEGDVA